MDKFIWVKLLVQSTNEFEGVGGELKRFKEGKKFSIQSKVEVYYKMYERYPNLKKKAQIWDYQF